MTAAATSADARPRRSERNALARLAGPLIVAQVSQVGMGFTDTVMAGRLSPLDLAAVALGSILWLPVFLLFFGLLNALAPTIAQLQGAGRSGAIGASYRQGVWLATALGVAAVPVTLAVARVPAWIGTVPEVADLTAAYLYPVAWGMPATCLFLAARFATEGVGRTRPVMYINLCGLALNALGNYAFMYGELGAPALGAVGCGVATFLVMWVDLLLLLGYLAWHPHFRAYALFRDWRGPERAAIAGLLRLGTPIALGIMTEVVMFLTVGLMMSTVSATAMAAHQVVLNLAALAFMVPLSIGMAVLIRVGHLAGAREYARARTVSLTGAGMSIASMAVSAGAMLLIPAVLVAVYTRDPTVTALAVELLLLAALLQIPDGLNITLVHALRGLKDAVVPMLIGILCYWVCGLGLAWYLGFVRGDGPTGLWSGLVAGMSLSCLLMGWRLHRVLAARERHAAPA